MKSDRSRTYRTEALVLKGYNYGEADRILTLFTPHIGKVRSIAKGVRRAKSRKSGHLDLFTRSSLLLARGRELDVVTQAETVETFGGMRTDLWRASQAHYVAELVDRFSAERMPNYPLYSLTVSTFRRLATLNSVDLAVRSFEVQLLQVTGYRPQLRRCVNCDSKVEPVINRFSVKLGGILCPPCSGVDSAAPPIGVDALKALRYLQTNEEVLLRADGVGEDVHRELERRLQEYITYHIESQPRSTGFLDRLRAEGIG